MAVAMTDAIPLLAEDGVSGRNTARDFRVQMIGRLFLSDGNLGVRSGVLPRRHIDDTYVDLRAIQLNTPGQAVQMYPGSCIVVRTGQGPYLATAETTLSNVPLPPAHASQNRYDVVYVTVYDHAIGDSSGGPHGPVVDVFSGPVAGSPSIPSIAHIDGAVPIAAVYRAANDNTVTASDITDLRRSTGLIGTPRIALPGDSVADAGVMPGERRTRFATPAQITAGSPPWVDEIWCADGKWRPATYEIVGRNRRATNTTTVATDPAFAYRIFTAQAPVLAGRTYEISGRGAFGHSVASTTVQVNFHYTTNGAEPTTASPVMFREIHELLLAGIPYSVSWSYLYQATTDHVLRVTPAMYTATGPGATLTFECAAGPNPAELIIADKGPTVAPSGTVYA